MFPFKPLSAPTSLRSRLIRAPALPISETRVPVTDERQAPAGADQRLHRRVVVERGLQLGVDLLFGAQLGLYAARQ